MPCMYCYLYALLFVCTAICMYCYMYALLYVCIAIQRSDAAHFSALFEARYLDNGVASKHPTTNTDIKRKRVAMQ